MSFDREERRSTYQTVRSRSGKAPVKCYFRLSPNGLSYTLSRTSQRALGGKPLSAWVAWTERLFYLIPLVVRQG